MTGREKLETHRYIGDGVYASFDGYHVWLHLGSHSSPRLVALEPRVLEALFIFGKDAHAGSIERTSS